MVVERDLTGLFDIELCQAPVDAVVDASHPKQRLSGMGSASRYLNAGVLLINRKVRLQQRVTEQALELIARHPDQLAIHDQDTLKILLEGAWLELEPQWNQSTGFLEQTASRLGLDRAAHARLRRDHVIIHVTRRSKPWEFTNDHPHKHRYLADRALAGMGTEPPRAKSVAEILRRGIKRVTP